MTKANLNDRIERIYRSAEGTNNAIELTKQLIGDILDSVLDANGNNTDSLRENIRKRREELGL